MINIESNYVLIGSLLYYGKNLIDSIYNYITSIFLVTVVVKNIDFESWILTNIKDYEISNLKYDQYDKKLKPCSFQKILIHQHVPLYLQYMSSEKSMIITTLNIPNIQNTLTDFIQTIDKIEKIVDKYIKFYKHDNYNSWVFACNLHFKDIHYIQSSKTRYLDKICQDFEHFKGRKEWYKSKNITFKRGYLLYGPPGTGKTSLIKNFAFVNDMNIYNIKLTKDTTSNILEELIQSVYEEDNSIIIFEDIDSLFPKNSDIPLSDLLNLFDGLVSSTGIIFMTTNHPEKLEPSFLRPGRVDYKLKIDFADDEMLYNMISDYRIDLSTKDKNQLLNKVISVATTKITLAELQSFLIFHLDHNLDTMLNSWDDFYKLEKEFAREFN